MSRDVAVRGFRVCFKNYSIYEFVDYLDSRNASGINGLKFYISKNGRVYDAIPLPERIISDFPDRAVAKLNLADAYCDSEYKEQSGRVFDHINIDN